jgi:hypothetical protein
MDAGIEGHDNLDRYPVVAQGLMGELGSKQHKLPRNRFDINVQ